MKIKLSSNQWKRIVESVNNKTMNKMAQAEVAGETQSGLEAWKAFIGKYNKPGNKDWLAIQEAIRRYINESGTQPKQVQAQQAQPVQQAQPQQQGAPNASAKTFSKLMQDPNFKSTFDTIKKQRQNEKRILQHWETMGIQYKTMPEIVQVIG